MSGLLTKRGDDAEARAERFAVVATTATIATGAEAAREVKQKQDAVLDAVRLLPPALKVVAKGVDRNAGMLDAALTWQANGGAR